MGVEGTRGCRDAGRFTWESGYDQALELLETDPVPTAVFCASDVMALGAARACQDRGLRVPDDISFIGVDDIEVAAYQIPALTTIRQSFAELATLAVQLLLQIIEHGMPEHTQIVIEPELIKRDSTAPFTR